MPVLGAGGRMGLPATSNITRVFVGRTVFVAKDITPAEVVTMGWPRGVDPVTVPVRVCPAVIVPPGVGGDGALPGVGGCSDMIFTVA
jgi:hypothetical protein